MDKHYGHGPAVSTEPPDQAIRQIPLATVENCLRYARSCARFDDLRGRPPLLEPRPHELYRRVSHDLNSSEHAVYGVVRRAVQLNWPGVWLSFAELGELAGRGRQTAVRAMRTLLRLNLLERMPMSMPGGPARAKGHDRSRTRNVYRLGGSARPPARIELRRRTRTTFSARVQYQHGHQSGSAIRSGETESYDSVSPLGSRATNAPLEVHAEGSSRVEDSASPSDRRLTPPSMPTSSGEQTQRLPNEKSKTQTSVVDTSQFDPDIVEAAARATEAFERYWKRPRSPADSERPIECYDEPAGGAP